MRPATRVALFYTVASVLWIVVTDWLVTVLGADVRWLQLGKGILFVVATGAILWFAVDVQSRRAASAEQALLEAKQQVEAVIDTSPMAIIALDSDAVVELWNPAAERIFGWSADEAVGVFNPIVPQDHIDDFMRDFRAVLAGEERSGFRAVRRRKSGALVDLIGYTAPLPSPDGGLEGAIALFADISEQVRSEAELKRYRERLEELVQARTAELSIVNEHLLTATRVKSEFLANMSHELRTPLNSIIGFSGAMLQGLAGDLNEEQAKQLTMVYRSGNHLLELINDILDLSKIEAGRFSIEVQQFDVVQLVESVVSTFEMQLADKPVDVGIEQPPEPVIVSTDRTKLRQILINIVGNAVKFTNEGHVKVRISSRRTWFEVDVDDTGPGIPRSEYALIFDEFTQSTRHADEKPKGTGLGLAISLRLARMLGGDITVSSVVGEGSTFKVRMPMTYVPDASQIPGAAIDGTGQEQTG